MSPIEKIVAAVLESANHVGATSQGITYAMACALKKNDPEFHGEQFLLRAGADESVIAEYRVAIYADMIPYKDLWTSCAPIRARSIDIPSHLPEDI